MRTILYTGHDEAYKPLAKITVPRMAEYAEHHGMDFTCYDKPLIDVPNGIYWTGVCGALKAFEEGYDRAIYLDVDQLITNMDYSVPNIWTYGFHASKDWGNDATNEWNFSMCGFVTFKTGKGIFETALSVEPHYRDKPFPEQLPMQEMAKINMQQRDDFNHYVETSGYKPLFKSPKDSQWLWTIHPRKVFNCVPYQVCPGNVPEPWSKGDFAAHLTMVDLPRRIEIANEILASL